MADYTKFSTVKFNKEDDFLDDRRQVTQFRFFVPGVNSGAYEPTLHIVVVITEWVARFFRLRRRSSSTSITLTDSQFDELFLEMQKIKKLRDGLQELKKENTER